MKWTPKMWIGVALFAWGSLAVMAEQSSGDPAADLGYSIISLAMLVGGAYLFWKGGRKVKK